MTNDHQIDRQLLKLQEEYNVLSIEVEKAFNSRNSESAREAALMVLDYLRRQENLLNISCNFEQKRDVLEINKNQARHFIDAIYSIDQGQNWEESYWIGYFSMFIPKLLIRL